MATEVTINRRRINIAGAKKHKTFNVTGDNAYTLHTRLRHIDFVGYDTSVITAVALSAGIITFTASGAFTADILAIGS